jgi:predicted nucleic acid-binding protein
MSVDLAAVVRRYKPEQKRRPLRYRSRADLPAFTDLNVQSQRRVLLDTNIYIFAAAGTLSSHDRVKLEAVLQHHSTVCLGELAVGLANRDVSSATWHTERRYWEELFASLPKNRTHAPDDEVWSAAGLLAGTLARTQGFQRHQRKDVLNDALIYMTALKRGVPVLTDNHTDFDLLNQLVPEGQFFLTRPAA